MTTPMNQISLCSRHCCCHWIDPLSTDKLHLLHYSVCCNIKYLRLLTLHAPKGLQYTFGLICLSVCQSVCLLPQNLPLALFIPRKESIIGFFMVFSRFSRVAFARNTSFESYGIIYWPPMSSSLPGELLMDKWDSNGFFSTRKVCVVSHKTTSSSLIVAH